MEVEPHFSMSHNMGGILKVYTLIFAYVIWKILSLYVITKKKKNYLERSEIKYYYI